MSITKTDPVSGNIDQATPAAADIVDFDTMRQLLVKRIIQALHIVVVIFVGICILALFLPGVDRVSLAGILFLALIETFVLMYVRKRVIDKDSVRAAYIFIFCTLAVVYGITLLTNALSIILIVLTLVIIFSLLTDSPNATVGIGALGLCLFLVSVFLFPAFYNEERTFLYLSDPIGKIFELLIITLALAANTIMIFLIGTLLRQTILNGRYFARTSDALRSTQQQTNERLVEQLTAQQRLLEIVDSLEAPIIPLVDGIIVVPLISTLDTSRMQAIEQRILQAISLQRSRLVILELTGVASIDTHIANQLIRLGQAIQLIGARTILTGMPSNIASLLVKLGADLSMIESYASIQDVLEEHFQAHQ